MKIRYVLFMLILIFSLNAKNINVTFVSPALQGDIYWDKVQTYMKAISENLEINLKIVYPDISQRIKYQQAIINELNSKNKPDYLIMVYQSLIGKEILELAETKKIYTFMFNTDIPENEKKDLKKPGEKYKYWMGLIYPDDYDAGYKLAKLLIEEAKSKKIFGEDGKIHIVGLSGKNTSTAAIERNKGLYKAVNEYKNDVVFHQLISTYWDPQKAYDITLNIFKRYPEINVIWAASDSIALNAIDAANTLDKFPNKDFITAGIDWSNQGISAVKEGTLSFTIGGHFLNSINALVLIKDHSEGLDIGISKFPIKTPMLVLNKNNINLYTEKLSIKNFDKNKTRSLSRFYNKKMEKYDYYFDSILGD